MKEKTCCFTGHRKIQKNEYENLKTKIKNEIVKLIEKGVKYFGTGGAIGFDTIAAEAVLELKELYPYIKLILVLPCLNQTKDWNIEDIKKYNYIKTKADKIKILSPNYYKGCMQKRNRHLIDNSAYCICYLRKVNTGTSYTVNYALKNNTNLIYV